MDGVPKQKRDCAALSRSFLFTGTSPELAVKAYKDSGCTCTVFEAGEKVYTRTRFRKSMGIVLSGRLAAYRPSEEGEAPVLLNTFYSGGVFGVAGLFHSAPAYVSEILAEKRSRVLFLTEELLHGLFFKDPRVAENYIGFLTGRICFLNARIDQFTGGSARGRLAEYLLFRYEQEGRPPQLRLSCSMTGLAEMLNIGRASLYRAFAALEAEGAVARSGRVLSMAAPELLRSGR